MQSKREHTNKQENIKEKNKTKQVPKKKLVKNNKKYTLLEKVISFLTKEKKAIYTQDRFPIEKIYSNGIIKSGRVYSKTYEFKDINYQLVKEERKIEILTNYIKFLNHFSKDTLVQFNFINTRRDKKELSKIINISENNDKFNDVRKEYTTMLREKFEEGNNGIEKKKYITIGIKAKNIDIAKQKLKSAEETLLENLTNIGVKYTEFSTLERINLISEYINEEKIENIDVEKDNIKTLLSPKELKTGRKEEIKVNNKFITTKLIKITSAELSDTFLKDLLDIEGNINITFNIEPNDKKTSIKYIKTKSLEINKDKAKQEREGAKKGYFSISEKTKEEVEDVATTMNELRTKQEKLFNVQIIALIKEDSKKELDNVEDKIISVVEKHTCEIYDLVYQQEDAYYTTLPICNDKLKFRRKLTTSSTAVFVPFTTQEIFTSGKATYYGLNAVSKNLIMADRTLLKNPNGLILGSPGSGKSFTAKREISDIFLTTDDDILICDPESEYGNLTKALGGQVIKINENSKTIINPLDINLNYGDDTNPITAKINFVHSLMELIIGADEGISSREKSIIDRCVREIYRKYINNTVSENIPILEDLYNELLKQEEKEAKSLATSLEIYVLGSLNVFNQHTNINLNERITSFDVKGLGEHLKKIGMLIVNDYVWNKVSVNRNLQKKTRYYLDEIHLMFEDTQTAKYCVGFWKRFRKWGGIPTGITQNVKDFFESLKISSILDNTDFIIMLNQGMGDRKILKEQLDISDEQISYVTNSEEGSGLIFYGDTILPFKDKFPKNTKLYRLMTSKQEEIAMYKKQGLL